MNRWYEQFSYSLEKKPITIYCVFTGGGTGANLTLNSPGTSSATLGTMPSVGFKGITSVARTGDGDYTLTFTDRYWRFLDWSYSVLSIDGSTAPVANAAYIKSISAAPATTGATVAFRTYLGTIGSLVAPGTNDRWFMSFTWSGSNTQ